jgi:hypothetical protein
MVAVESMRSGYHLLVHAMASARAPDLGPLLSRPTLLVEVLSRHHPIPRALLRRYAQVWDWAALSSNTAIEWDLEWILEQRERWDWPQLCCNPALPCSVELLRELVASGKCDWLDFRRQPRTFERADLFALCLLHWSAAAESQPERFPKDEDGDQLDDWFGGMPWGPELRACATELVERIAGFRWDLFSEVEGFPWTIEIIDRHRDELDWSRLSQNTGLPWSLELLETFAQRWDWRGLGYNRSILWEAEWVDRLSAHVHWATVDTIAALRGQGERLRGLVNSPTLVWTPEFFDRHHAAIEAHVARLRPESERYWTHACDANNWTADLVRHLAPAGRVPWANLCRTGRGLWTRGFIDQFRTHLDLGELTQNPEFPWWQLLDEFAEQLSRDEWHALSRNSGFVPSAATLRRYEDRWSRAALMGRLPLTIELLDTFADHYLGRHALVDNPHLDAEMIVHLRDHWTTEWTSFTHRPDAIELVEAHPELPWDVVALAYDHGGRVCEWISLDIVEQLAQSLADAEREPRNLQLELMIANAAQRNEHLRVYADWLEERGDPHAQLIRAMIDGGDETAIQALVHEYERTLQADGWTLRWRDGFVREAFFGLEWRRALDRRALRFVEALDFHDSTDPLSDADFELLRPLDRLRKLGVSGGRIVRSDALAAVPELEYLRLVQAELEELSQLAGRAALRHLLLPWTRVRDLGPLAEVPNLTWLKIEHSKVVADLSPLRACVRLVELDIRSTAVRDLSPLHELPALRRVFLHDSAADEREVMALQRAQPGLHVFSSADDWLRQRRPTGWFGVPEDC